MNKCIPDDKEIKKHKFKGVSNSWNLLDHDSCIWWPVHARDKVFCLKWSDHHTLWMIAIQARRVVQAVIFKLSEVNTYPYICRFYKERYWKKVTTISSMTTTFAIAWPFIVSRELKFCLIFLFFFTAISVYSVDKLPIYNSIYWFFVTGDPE